MHSRPYDAPKPAECEELIIISTAKPTSCTSVSILFHFGIALKLFRIIFPSIIRSSRLSIQQPKIYCSLLASKQTALSVWTVLNSWCWTERPSETCRVSFQNKINLILGAASWFCYRNNITMHGPVNVKLNVRTLHGGRNWRFTWTTNSED